MEQNYNKLENIVGYIIAIDFRPYFSLQYNKCLCNNKGDQRRRIIHFQFQKAFFFLVRDEGNAICGKHRSRQEMENRFLNIPATLSSCLSSSFFVVILVKKMENCMENNSKSGKILLFFYCLTSRNFTNHRI